MVIVSPTVDSGSAKSVLFFFASLSSVSLPCKPGYSLTQHKLLSLFSTMVQAHMGLDLHNGAFVAFGPSKLSENILIILFYCFVHVHSMHMLRSQGSWLKIL